MTKALMVVAAMMFLTQRLVGYDRVLGRQAATRSEVIAQHGMAATSQPLATQAALDILKAGGTAVDAAIAANAVLTVVEPTGCGLGGDLFAIVWDAKSARLAGLNGSGRSPRALTLEHLRSRGLAKIPSHGALPVTVPGCADAWFELHARFGRLPMAEVLAPAIRYAREGFPVSEIIASGWAQGVSKLKDFPGFREVFMPAGRAPAKGEIFRNAALADTLEKLAAGGRDAFYRGDIARAIDRFMKDPRVGGFLAYEDLAAHKSEWVEPVSASYRGFDLWELPPNGQGIAVLQILNLLEAYDLRALGRNSAEYWHLFLEAKKLAFEDRARFYADPAFSTVPVAALISKKYAATRRALIDPKSAARRADAGNPALAAGDTIYLAAADGAGNMVSLIQSNYRGMGSGITPPGLGFVLQDRGELFSLEAGHANVYAPGKRPFHTIIPGFVTRAGKPWLSFGVMGGAAQPQAQVQVLVNLIDFGMNLQEAGDAARIVHEGSSEPTGERMEDGGTVQVEEGIASEVIEGLRARGHRIGNDVGIYGGYQAILWNEEQRVYYGASEARKDGQAAGY
ncbi:MAG: gamma-glutamyltransferase [Planctomycetes bacterium]|nr:gamma-glutamyltransferase [Planctomycetota bacterium]